MVSNEIVVSICCITYNHAPYIRQCLDGFMMQQTDFAFEVLIHDDASTDGTTEIIKEYEVRYPDVIKPIYEEENQWVKGRRGSAVFNFPRARGKYIAMCEGDDYWTDPLKLQKQVNLLNKHIDVVLCSHLFATVVGGAIGDSINRYWQNRKFNLKDIMHGEWPLQTATIMFRKEALNSVVLTQYDALSDTILVYLLLKEGYGYVMPDIMSIYRESSQGIWSSLDDCAQWANVAKERLRIYDVERSIETAQFVIQSTKVNIGRYAYLKHLSITLRIIYVMIRHLGYLYTFRWVAKKFIIGRAY